MPSSLLPLVAVLVCCLPGSWASQYDPHLPGSAPSSFEGWYIRLLTAHPAPPAADVSANNTASPTAGSDPPSQLPASLVLIVASMPHASAPNATYMVSLAVQNNSRADPRPVLYTRQGVALSISSSDHPVTADPDLASPPHFRLAAPDGSLLVHMDGERCQVHARFKDASLIAQCSGAPLPWSASGMGPESCATALPASLAALHWYVHSLATPMRYSLLQGSQPAVHGEAVAHMEKNWGLTFPNTWYWAQGLNLSSSWEAGSRSSLHGGSHSSAGDDKAGDDRTDGDSSGSSSASSEGATAAPVRAAFALAGGKLPSPLVPEGWLPHVWLLGVRTLNHSWYFHPWDSIFTAQPSPCQPNTVLLLTASQPLTRREVEVQVRARRTSFAEMQCPTQEGFSPFSDQSLTASATVRLFEYRVGSHERGWVQKQLVEAFEFEGAALEFGGAARCPHGSISSSAGYGAEEGSVGLAAAV